MGVTALTFQFWEKIDPSIQIMELTSSDRAVHRGCVCKANIEKRLWRKLLYHIVKTWLSIILVYFDRIIASNSERAGHGLVRTFARRAIEPPPPAVGKGLRKISSKV